MGHSNSFRALRTSFCSSSGSIISGLSFSCWSKFVIVPSRSSFWNISSIPPGFVDQAIFRRCLKAKNLLRLFGLFFLEFTLFFLAKFVSTLVQISVFCSIAHSPSRWEIYRWILRQTVSKSSMRPPRQQFRRHAWQAARCIKISSNCPLAMRSSSDYAWEWLLPDQLRYNFAQRQGMQPQWNLKFALPHPHSSCASKLPSAAPPPDLQPHI